MTVTNIKCKKGFFLHKGKCISCPEGSYWNEELGKCTKRVIDQPPRIENPPPAPTPEPETKKPEEDKTNKASDRDELDKANKENEINVAPAWAVVSPSSSDLRIDCLYKEIRTNAEATTATTGG